MIKRHHTGKYTEIVHIKDGPRTQEYAVILIHPNIEVGILKWYPPWKSYSFFPHSASIHSLDALLEITAFMQKLQRDWYDLLESENAH